MPTEEINLQLHPLKTDGTIDADTNLYPITKASNVLDDITGEPISFEKEITTGEFLNKSENNELNIDISALMRTVIPKIYPIGGVFVTFRDVDSPMDIINPNNVYGTIAMEWTKIEGKFILASSDNHPLGAEDGGSEDAVVVSHTHPASFTGTEVTTSNSGEHTHSVNLYASSDNAGYIRSSRNRDSAGQADITGGAHTHKFTAQGTVTVNTFGESGTGKNMPPYTIANVWKRTL